MIAWLARNLMNYQEYMGNEIHLHVHLIPDALIELQLIFQASQSMRIHSL